MYISFRGRAGDTKDSDLSNIMYKNGKVDSI